MITVQSCWTKPFYNSLLNSAQVQILRSLGSPACGSLRIPKLAGYHCLAQFFPSLMHMNCSRAPSSMLMSILVCSKASHCLLIKLILVKNAGSLVPKRQKGEEDLMAPLSHKVRLPRSLFTTSAWLDQVIKKIEVPFVLQREILSHCSCKRINQKVFFCICPLVQKTRSALCLMVPRFINMWFWDEPLQSYPNAWFHCLRCVTFMPQALKWYSSQNLSFENETLTNWAELLSIEHEPNNTYTYPQAQQGCD